MMTGTAIAAAAAACGTVAGSGQAGVNAVAAQAGTISETGSSLLYPLMRSWAAAYQQGTPGVTVSTASTSSGTGIAAASAGTTDLGASDAYLSSGDLVKNPALLNIPLAVSAQTVIYNLPDVSGHVRLDGTILAEIYDGTIRTWDDPRIAAINQHVNLPASEATPGCLAYNGIRYLAQAEAGGLGEAELANHAGQYTLPAADAVTASVGSFVSLTPPNETISMIDGPALTGYPVVNYEYAVVSTRQPDAARASALKAFLRWVITTGNDPKYVDAVGFQPLPPALVALGKQQIEEIGP
jgi:phosphate transport system substrate-binding protein